MAFKKKSKKTGAKMPPMKPTPGVLGKKVSSLMCGDSGKDY